MTDTFFSYNSKDGKIFGNIDFNKLKSGITKQELGIEEGSVLSSIFDSLDTNEEEGSKGKLDRQEINKFIQIISSLVGNDTKLDVANKSRGSSPWWVTLKRLRETARARNLIFNTRGVIPQSTIAISQYEVDAIKERYGYDLANPQFGVRVMNALFLMCFIIVDEGTRTVNILYDGSKSYQTYALETLEREVTMSSNKIGKELTRMISR